MPKWKKILVLCLSLSQISTGAFAQSWWDSQGSNAETAEAKPNKAGAAADGQSDGDRDGRREATVRGPQDGAISGDADGAKEGFLNCTKEEKQKAYDVGYGSGYQAGSNRGQSTADKQARIDSDTKARIAGTAEGTAKADAAAKEAATPMGTLRGNDEAKSGDSQARGWQNGGVVGDEDAYKRSREIDYPLGHKQYFQERFAQSPLNEDAFSQRQRDATANIVPLLSSELAESSSASQNPDRRFFRISRAYNFTAETKAYQAAYEKAYTKGYQSQYPVEYRTAFDASYKTAYGKSCAVARNGNYQNDQDRGARDGNDQGYFHSYQDTYDKVSKSAYEASFLSYSQKAEKETFPTYYQKHFEIARLAALEIRSKEIYEESFKLARQKKDDESYAAYADQAKAEGREDEAKDFADRPVRLLEVSPTESIQNGLFEPGEALRLTFQIRNFSNQPVARQDVEVRVQTSDAASTVISEVAQNISRDLKPDSITDVTEALEFRVNENAVNGAIKFKAVVAYKGQIVGEKDFIVTSKWFLNVELAEAPSLQQGVASIIKVRLKSMSQTATIKNFKLSLSTDPNVLEVLESQQTISSLGPQQDIVVGFPVIARKGGASVSFPISLVATTERGRRVGILETAPTVAVANDYEVTLLTDVKLLKKAGVQRINYKVVNRSSRAVVKGLQLRTQVMGRNAANFKVMGPNPQYLNPLTRGETSTFAVPVMVKEAGQGGTLELEVQEAGRTVVVHRFEF
jgi:hypothetical protein